MLYNIKLISYRYTVLNSLKYKNGSVVMKRPLQCSYKNLLTGKKCPEKLFRPEQGVLWGQQTLSISYYNLLHQIMHLRTL